MRFLANWTLVFAVYGQQLSHSFLLGSTPLSPKCCLASKRFHETSLSWSNQRKQDLFQMKASPPLMEGPVVEKSVWHALRSDLWDFAPSAGWMALAGSVLGPALDAFHSRVAIVVYDVGKVYIPQLDWCTNVFVPPLLAAFFAVVGTLFILGDTYERYTSNKTSDELDPLPTTFSPVSQLPPLPSSASLFSPFLAKCRSPTPIVVAAAFGATALSNQLSALLYTGGSLYTSILAIMGLVGAMMWFVFDGTVVGLAITALAAISAPPLEAVIMSLFGLWHYPQGDVLLLGQSLASFVPALYFVFTVPVGVTARCLKDQLVNKGTKGM
ncbi:unnamed protein product [Choristocarpus tenellus]